VEGEAVDDDFGAHRAGTAVGRIGAGGAFGFVQPIRRRFVDFARVIVQSDGGTFADVATIGPLVSARAVAVGDLDGDDLDEIVVIGEDSSRRQTIHVYKSPFAGDLGPGDAWLTIDAGDSFILGDGLAVVD